MGKGSSLQFPTPFAEKVLQRYHQHEMTNAKGENRGIMRPRRRTRMDDFWQVGPVMRNQRRLLRDSGLPGLRRWSAE